MSSTEKTMFLYQIIFFLIISIVLFIIISVFIQVYRHISSIKLEHKHELDKKMISVLESERKTIAYDLHDSVLKKLAFIKQQLNTEENKDEELVKKLVDTSILELRTIYLSLQNQKQISDPLNKKLDYFFIILRCYQILICPQIILVLRLLN